MANTANYKWPLPSPTGLQMNEVAKIATSLIAIDAKFKATETALSTHKHSFADLLDRPTTLAGYGITDSMTADEVAAAIHRAVSDLVNGSGAALDTLKELADALGNDPQFATTVGNALGLRVRVDAAQPFTLAEKAQGRSNLDALGTLDKGKADGVASLDSTGKVPPAQLPALTTTATVGAAMAGSNGKTTPADGDFFAGVEAGGSTMFKTTWGNAKAALAAIHYTKAEVNSIVAGNMAGRAYTRRSDGAAINWAWSGQGGQPSWLWGGNDGYNMYVYNPANFNVASVGGWNIQAILNQIESRAAAFADDRANRKARKAGSWDQWNFTSHDQRMQNNTGENIYFTAKLTGTYADNVMLQISPDNGTYWTVAHTMAGSNANAEYSAGCLPPGWWMRLIRSSGSYNANVILIW